MTLRKQIIIVIVSTVLILTALLYGHASVAWQANLAELENESVQKDITRLRQTIDKEAGNLATTTRDWASWDDTYAFMANRNQEYIDSNLADSTFTSLGINLMLLVSTEGEIVYGKAFDLKNNIEVPYPKSIIEHILPGQPLVSHSQPESSLQGILILPEGPLMVASRPILTSEYQGPVRGTLVIGRYMTQAELVNLTGLPWPSLAIYRWDNQELPGDVHQVLPQLARTSDYIQPINQDTIAGYAILNDLYGKPALILRIENPRNYYTQGQREMRTLIAAFLIFSLVTCAFVLLQLDRLVLKRLSLIGHKINAIRTSGDPALRIEVKGKDELSALAQDINQMLSSLETSRSQLSQALQELGTRTDTLTDINQALQLEINQREKIEKDLKTKASQQQRLIEAAQNLTISLEVHEVLQRVAQGAKEVLDAKGCIIYLLANDKKTLNPVVAIEPPIEQEILSAPLDINRSLTGQAVKAKQGLIFNNPNTNPHSYHIPGTPDLNDEKVIVAPFIIDGKAMGAMCLDRMGVDFTTQDLALAETFAAYASAAMKNAQAHDELQREVKERRQVETSLRESEVRYRNLFSGTPVGLYRTNINGQILDANQALAEMLGFANPESLIQHNAEEFYLDPHERQQIQQLMDQKDVLQSYEHQLRRRDGKVVWASDSFRAFRDGKEKILYYEGSLVDITRRKQAEQVQSALYKISQSVSETHNLEEQYQRVHQVIKELLPAENFYVALYDPATTMLSFPYFVDQFDPPPTPRKLDRSLTAYVIRSGKPLLAVPEEFTQLSASGEVESMGSPSLDWLGIPLKTANNVTIGAMVVQTYDEGLRYKENDKELLTIVSTQIAMAIERKRAEEKLSYNAFHDELTGLPNRTLFMDRLGHAIELSKRRKDQWFAVLFLDLDRFKTVNDSLGHVLGDQLLVSASRRLQTCLRTSDTIARFGGDEFVILLENLDGTREATQIADRILKDMMSTFNLAGHEVVISTSIGIVFSSQSYEKPEEVLRDADIAMYRAKALGRGRYVVFNTAMRTHVVAHMELENNLRLGIERQELVLHYQPILSLKTGKITGFEALVRWNHPEKGLIRPADFIPFAEETGLIIPMGEWVLNEACRQMSAWHKQFPSDPPLMISVNLSNKQFAQPDLFEQIEHAIDLADFDAHYLQVEITESVIMENAELAIATLNRLRQMGVQVQIDDFGTGYSSLVYLHMLPINAIKIDRSFISGSGIQDNGLEIAQTIVRLAHDLKVDAIAEGVETQAQLEKLQNLECEYAQGYHISRCLEKGAAEQLLREKFGNV
jgi:diguanylate cyclase (GGDEF)-like protein/PAS domain S-box-containing protein